MILLDMRTIVFSNVLTSIVCLVVVVLLWRQSRGRFAGMGFLVFDFILQTAALFLIILRGNIPNWMSIVLSNTMVVAGALLGYMGLSRFLGEKSTQIHNYVLLTAFACAHTYFTFFQPDQAARNLNLSIGLLAICFQCAWLLLYRVPAGLRRLTFGVGIIFSLYCIVSVIRIIEFSTGEHTATDYLRSGIFEQFVLISYQMLFILLTYGLTLMVNKRLLTEIKTEEDKFSKAFHSSPYAITLTRLSDGQIIEVNEGFFKITGYQPEEIRGKTTSVLHLWDRAEDRAFVVGELASKGMVQGREFQFRKKSGERITGLFSAEIITINNEKCVLSSINDISERKKAEEKLKESERQYRDLFENSLEGIFQTTPEGKLISVNIAFARMFGYESSEEITGAVVNIASQLYANPEERKKTATILRETGYLNDFECQMRRKDGATFWALINARFAESSDSTRYFEGFIIDITERKREEEEIQRLNVELEKKVSERTKELHDSQLALLNLVDDLNQSSKNIDLVNQSLAATNKELEAFSYSVSHDLRAPLRSIDGFSLALLEDYQKTLDETGRSYLDKVRKATQHMGNLIDDMLKLSRVTQSEFNYQSLDLSKMIRSISATVQKNNPQHNVKMTIQEDIVIQGDPHTMQIALTNLIENAWKFTGKQKHPRIEFGATLKENEKIFFIRDNGVGFDMSYVGKLFGAFQRLHTTKEFAGTGIGLATVKRIITRHGGQIWAEGEVGKGAVFYFTLK